MAKYRVAITNNAFAPLGPEREILEPLGCEIVFRQSLQEDEVIALVAGADAIICDAAPITPRALDAAPRLRVISEYGIGYDNIDVAAATARGVWVANVPGFCTAEVADHTIAGILALSRRLFRFDAAIRRGEWGAVKIGGTMTRLGSQTLGLVGFGRIARAVAERARAHGMRVVCWSPNTTPELARANGAERRDLDDLFRESDFVALLVANAPQTRHLVNARRLALMKPTAYIVNTGRGALVDEVALVAALRNGTIAGAALDVFDPEPPLPDNPLLGLENVILTPHVAFYSQESLRELQVSAAENVAAVLRGGRPTTPVNAV